MGDNTVSYRAAGSWRGKAPHAAAAVAAVIVLIGTACSTVTSGASARAKAPAVIVLKQGANNGNGDIFITPSGGSVSGPEIISNTGKVISDKDTGLYDPSLEHTDYLVEGIVGAV